MRHVSQRFEISDQPGDVVAEGEALEQALLAVRADREELEGRTRQRLSAAEAAIFAAQRELLADPALVREALATIIQGLSPIHISMCIRDSSIRTWTRVNEWGCLVFE